MVGALERFPPAFKVNGACENTLITHDGRGQNNNKFDKLPVRHASASPSVAEALAAFSPPMEVSALGWAWFVGDDSTHTDVFWSEIDPSRAP